MGMAYFPRNFPRGRLEGVMATKAPDGTAAVASHRSLKSMPDMCSRPSC